MPAPTIDPDYITRGTPEYDEVSRILGPRCRWVADERVRQINGRWLKADCFVPDAAGQHTIVGDEVLAKSRRIRIPKDSFLRRRRFRRNDRRN